MIALFLVKDVLLCRCYKRKYVLVTKTKIQGHDFLPTSMVGSEEDEGQQAHVQESKMTVIFYRKTLQENCLLALHRRSLPTLQIRRCDLRLLLKIVYQVQIQSILQIISISPILVKVNPFSVKNVPDFNHIFRLSRDYVDNL